MTDNIQPEALRLAKSLDLAKDIDYYNHVQDDLKASAAELRRQHARIADLESQLESIGAGGVNGPLMGSAFTAADMPEGITRDDTVHGETYYTAADMATASAQGFRDGVASLGSNEGSIEGSSEGSEPAPTLTQGAAIEAVADALPVEIAELLECSGCLKAHQKTKALAIIARMLSAQDGSAA